MYQYCNKEHCDYYCEEIAKRTGLDVRTIANVYENIEYSPALMISVNFENEYCKERLSDLCDEILSAPTVIRYVYEEVTRCIYSIR